MYIFILGLLFVIFIAIGLMAQAAIEIGRLKKECRELIERCESVTKTCEDSVKSLKEGRG